VYFENGTLFSLSFDPRRLEASGNPVQMVQGILPSGNVDALLSVSRNGSLIYVPGTSLRYQTNLGVSERNGATERLKLPRGIYQGARVSPDGKRIAFSMVDGNDANIWTYDLSHRTAANRLTFGGHNRFPLWSSDGQRIAFQSDREGDEGIYWQRADGTGLA